MAAAYRSLRAIDWPLLILTLAICGMGVLQIYSATHDNIWRDAWWKQVVYLGAALVVLWIVMQIDYHTLLSYTPWLYGAAVAGLVAVLFVGTKVFGSRRWIPLPGGFMFQVSEFIKVVLVLYVARELANLKREHLEWRDMLKVGVLIGVPMFLVMLQPDLGTSLTYIPILAVSVFLAGLRWQHWATLAIIFALILPIAWFGLKDYQKARLVTFLDPNQDPKGSGYQVIQSKIAVGAGGMWGKGVTRGSQTQLRFLPVPHTDFIFSAFAEEHGFVGVIVVLALYFLLLMQIVQNAQIAPDKAGTYICISVAALLLFHLLVNVGMVLGRMPVTGIPLPLMSSGGSSLLTIFIMLGLVNNVRLRRFVN